MPGHRRTVRDAATLLVAGFLLFASVVLISGPAATSTPNSPAGVGASPSTHSPAIAADGAAHDTEYSVVFTEVGLPAGTVWGVELCDDRSSPDCSTQSSDTATITFGVAYGNYTFTVEKVAGYTAAPSSGGIGSSSSRQITFTPIPPERFPVTFHETGLSPGTSWSVDLNGTTLSGSSTSLATTEPNGTYPFSVPAVQGHNASPSSGQVHVEGNAVTTQIAFSAVYAVTFVESGLPSDALWSVTLGTATETSLVTESTDSIQFTVQNGTYPYVVTPPAGYDANPSSNSVTVAGGALFVDVTFSDHTYAVTFEETGLDEGTSWAVQVTGGPSPAPGPGDLTTNLPNGSYSYSIPWVEGYIALNPSGNFLVDGADITIDTSFSVVYTVTFEQSDQSQLPEGASWSVTLGALSISDTSDSIPFENVSAGNYGFQVAARQGYTVVPAAGTVTVQDSDVSVEVTFTQTLYPVVFDETGLPKGSSWTVTINESAQTEPAGSAIGTNLPDGPFTYRVSDVPGYHQTTVPYSGGGIVNGGGITVTLLFHRVTYLALFNESGLPNGTRWYVNVSDEAPGSNLTFEGTGSLGVLTPNGTQSYTVSVASLSWQAITQSGNLTVSGSAPAPISIAFVYAYKVTVTASGLPVGTEWSVSLNGQLAHSDGAVDRATPPVTTDAGVPVIYTFRANVTTMAFALPNGTYVYAVASTDSSLAPDNATGSETVDGGASNASLAVTFVPTSGASPTFLGLPELEGYAVLGALLVVIVAGLAFVLARHRRPPPARQEPGP